tara:strand:- start:8523 stop:8756 length:234 start_codon:yes stop_codon:yes gene_type:complete
MNIKDIEDFKKIKFEIDELKQKLNTITNAKFRLKESNINIKSDFYKSIIEKENTDKEKLEKLMNKLTFINIPPSEKD